MSHVTEKYFDAAVQAIAESVSFDSSMKPAEGNYPFGKETADCLAHFLKIAEDMGFETHNYDNYVGEVVFGEGEEIAVLAHLDVVPAGSGWKYPPFGAVINDDVSDGGMARTKMWGRGTMDDKGPAVATLFSLKALKDSGFSPKRKIKLIVGCNEESGWACLDHYNKVAKMPDEGFSPDADFPVIYAEKGIYHFESVFPIENAPFTSFSAGERVNMVCDGAQAVLTEEGAEKFAAYQGSYDGVRLEYDEKTGILKAFGKSAHGSTPEKGANALGGLLQFFASFNKDIKKAFDVLFADSASLKTMQDETGYLTMSPDLAKFENGALVITTDIRFPATHKKREIEEKLEAAGVTYREISYQAPLYNDPNGKLISTLMQVYNRVTGRNEKPVAIGGGTYARALKCGCGFGPEFENEEATIHQANEYILLDRIRLMLEIYYEALKALTN
ncbi:MAG: Sapep family Mn(2+)-dependent dipeptidase [Clostridia bacterium]|nr:Sapep family Mn(2+)-dependent dipeptidase [Clostridia bacterium]